MEGRQELQNAALNNAALDGRPSPPPASTESLLLTYARIELASCFTIIKENAKPIDIFVNLEFLVNVNFQEILWI